MSISGFYTNVARRMNHILVRGYNDEGERFYEKFKYRPQMFVEAKDPDNAKWKRIDGTPLDAMRFDSMSECRKFLKTYEGLWRIDGNARHIPGFIQSQWPNEIEYDAADIDVAYIDIETYSGDGFPDPAQAQYEILTITLKSSRDDCYTIWGLKYYNASKSNVMCDYRKFNNEAEMLEDFLEWWSLPDNTPDVVTGWNTLYFDMPYIVNRVARVLGADAVQLLSPWREVSERKVTKMGREQIMFDLLGVSQLDYLDLFKKFTLNTYGQQESYRLDFIAELVLGANKHDYSDVGTLQQLYDHDFQRFLDYNIQDVDLIVRFEEKLGLIALVYQLAYFGGVNYSDTLGTVAIWDSIIFRHLAKQNIAVPPTGNNHHSKFAGGFVKEPQVGMHDWVISLDLNSLYPNIIVQNNMSPEMLLEDTRVHGCNPDVVLKHVKDSVPLLKDGGAAVAANGTCFSSTRQGFLPEIIEKLYSDRVEVKGKMLTSMKKLQALKEELTELTTPK